MTIARPWTANYSESYCHPYKILVASERSSSQNFSIPCIRIASLCCTWANPSPHNGRLHTIERLYVCLFVCLRFNGTFRTNRLYRTIKVGNISCRGRRQHKIYNKTMKQYNEPHGAGPLKGVCVIVILSSILQRKRLGLVTFWDMTDFYLKLLKERCKVIQQ